MSESCGHKKDSNPRLIREKGKNPITLADDRILGNTYGQIFIFSGKRNRPYTRQDPAAQRLLCTLFVGQAAAFCDYGTDRNGTPSGNLSLVYRSFQKTCARHSLDLCLHGHGGSFFRDRDRAGDHQHRKC